MKTATDSPANGQTVEKTTVTRVFPTDLANPPEKIEFWEYARSLPADWGNPPDQHLLYVYRILAETGPMQPLEKCTRMSLPDKTQVDVRDREEFEFGLFQKYGGGIYRLILKRKGQWVAQERVRLEGAPKHTQPGILADNPPDTNPTVTTDSASDVAKTAMNLVGNRDAEAVNVAINALRGASEVVQRFSVPPSGSGGPINEMLLQAIIQRALNPPDPIESLLKLAALAKDFGIFGGGGGAVPPAVAKIIDTALERFGNPVPNGPATSTTTALVQTLPAIASHVKEALTEWRVGMEVQRDTILRTQPQAQLPPGAPAQPSPTVIQPPRPAAPANGTPEVQQMAGPPLDFIEMKIVEILRETMGEPNGADIAGEEVFIFVDRMDPRLTAHLAGMGEAGLFQLFQERPILKTVATNTPRLQEFIKAFLKYAKPPEAPGNGAVVPAKPN